MKTPFIILQKLVSCPDTLEFREKHIPEIIQAMEEYANQFKRDGNSEKKRELLTDERLLKFGFKKSTWNKESKIPCFIKRRLVIFDDKDQFDVRIETEKGKTAFIRFVKYVDELQSLYPHLAGDILTDEWFTEEDVREFYFKQHGETNALEGMPHHEKIGLMAESLDLEYCHEEKMWTEK